MAYTSLLGLIQPVTGTLTNTWGTAVNNQLTQLIEDSIAQRATANITSSDWTLTTTTGGVQNEARNAILIATGTPATTRYIYAPKQSKTYVVINNTSDGSNVYICGGPTSPTTGVVVASGSAALVAWDTSVSDFVKVAGGGGGATGGGNDTIFFNNGQTVTTTYTIPATTNAGTFGPISINAGVVVTVPDDSSWTVV
jgi:hypothetical protein